MNQKILKVGNETILLKEVPGDSVHHFIDNKGHLNYSAPLDGKFRPAFDLPPGNWQLMFTFSKDSMPTEEQAGEVVDKHEIVGHWEYTHAGADLRANFTALDSFSSLLSANEVLLENPKERPHPNDYSDHKGHYLDDMEEWQKAEEKAWRGKIVVLKTEKTNGETK